MDSRYCTVFGIFLFIIPAAETNFRRVNDNPSRRSDHDEQVDDRLRFRVRILPGDVTVFDLKHGHLFLQKLSFLRRHPITDGRRQFSQKLMRFVQTFERRPATGQHSTVDRHAGHQNDQQEQAEKQRNRF